MNEQTNGQDQSSAGMRANAGHREALCVAGVYEIECRGPDGAIKWTDRIENLVTTAGKNKLVDAALKTGLAAPAWYIGLVNGAGGSNTYAAADTMASHAGWTESTAYSEGARQAFTPGSVSGGAVDNSAAKAVFTLNGSATIGGCFLVDNSTKGGTTGTLMSVGSHSNGDKSGGSGDTITVTYTFTAS